MSYSGKYSLHCPHQQFKGLCTWYPNDFHSGTRSPPYISLHRFTWYPDEIFSRKLSHSGFHSKWSYHRSCTKFHFENELLSGLKIANLVVWGDWRMSTQKPCWALRFYHANLQYEPHCGTYDTGMKVIQVSYKKPLRGIALDCRLTK